MYREARKALIVGIDDYPCSPLKGCVSDAVKLSKLLKSHYDGKPNFETKTLLSSNGKIEKTLLKEEIENLFSGSPVIALLYFAGHGYLNSYGGYLVTQDFDRYDEGVSMDEIMRCANESEAQNKVIILDCCYSGRLAAPRLVNRKVSELADGVTILTSCQATETAQENNKKGIFSSLLLDAIDGQCADLTGNILPSNIYAYIDRTLGQWGGQRPIFKTNVSAFISLKEVEPLIELSVLRKIITYFSDRDAEYPLNPGYEFTEPAADDKCVAIFKELQKMEGVGLVAPVGEEHMYYAAINSKSCRLTNLGKQYWSLIKLEKV